MMVTLIYNYNQTNGANIVCVFECHQTKDNAEKETMDKRFVRAK